ncbi:hypothetical protein ACS0TY_006843 [Phlomoides rotata]
MSMSELIISITTNVASFIFIIFYCIFYSWIITLQDFYSFLRLVFHLLFVSCMSLCQLSNTSNVVHDDASTSRPCLKMEITREDVEIVMEKLGLKNDRRVDQAPFIMSQENIENIFYEREPSLDEVREAFGVFDENNDGFVDAKELKRVMSSLGMEGLSEQECMRMITAFDDDGDGRIDFGEFVKLIEENVCC